jgi:hypothetical protein
MNMSEFYSDFLFSYQTESCKMNRLRPVKYIVRMFYEN